MKTAFRFSAVGLASLLLGACEVPSIPNWDLTVRLPDVADTVSIREILPDSLQVSEDAFVLPGASVKGEFKTSDICEAAQMNCALIPNGSPVIYPAFSLEEEETLDFPAELSAISMKNGQLAFTVSHSLPYSLLQNTQSGETGKVVAILTNPDGSILAGDSILGSAEPLSAGTVGTLTLNLAGKRITPDPKLTIRIVSPGSGDFVPFKHDGQIAFTGAIESALAQSFSIALTQALTTQGSTEIPLSSETLGQIDSRAQRASFQIQLTSPYTLNGSLNLRVAASQAAASAQQWVTSAQTDLAQGTNTLTLTLDKAQVGQLLSDDGDGIFFSHVLDVQPSVLTVTPLDAFTLRFGGEVTLLAKSEF